MRALVLSVLLGVLTLGLLAATPSTAEARPKRSRTYVYYGTRPGYYYSYSYYPRTRTYYSSPSYRYGYYPRYYGGTTYYYYRR